jgi:putative ABC transport system substrate-binding protein
MLPHLSHVGVLWCGASNAVSAEEWAETQAAADVLKVRLTSLEARGRDDLGPAFATAVKQRVQAILGFDCPLLGPSAAQLAELSLKHRLPSMYPFPLFPRAGNLMSYGATSEDAPRRAATYVDRILKGAKPADLPVQQPNKFELVVNVKTARALGLTIPQSVLVRTDQVIE